MKKKILTTLSVVLVLGLAALGILAYLQDDDSDVNVMTLGEVKIAQHEYQRVVNTDGAYQTDTIDGVTSYVLEDFEQGKALLPTTEATNFGAGGYDSTVVRMTQVDSYGYMQVFESENAVDKFVTVENTGKTDAYVRTLIAFEIGNLTYDEWINAVRKSYHMCWNVGNVGFVEIDGNNYYVVECIYSDGDNAGARHQNGVLTAGETTYPSLSQVYMTATSTNETVKALDGNGNGTYDILVLSQAVQTEGFSDAKTALDTAFGTATDNAAIWFGGIAKFVIVDGEKVAIEGEEAEAILSTLEAGTDLIVDEDVDIIAFDANEVDAQGATVTLAGQGPEAYGYLAFMPDAGENVTLSNLNVTGSGFVCVGYYGQGGGTYELNNVKIENFASTLKNGDKGFNLACAFMHYGNATLNNCVMTGTTAIQEGAMPVDLASANGFTTVVNGGEYGTIYSWSHAYTTINGAEVDTMYVAPIKGTVTIKAGSHVGTLNIDYGTSAKYATEANLAKIDIEEGATVDKIVFNGTTYTLAEWNAR